MLWINDHLSIGEDELDERFVRASGPGGQNVNKVATAVQLRFDVAHSPSLPEAVRSRLVRLAGRRMTTEGVLVIDARRFRTQDLNRTDARERLAELIRRATMPAKPRRPTKPSKSAVRAGKEAKRSRSQLKKSRSRPAFDDA
ncbi:MAG: aminoacyl-tRNA hydrolase [Rhodospirillaceae bacterium]|nr:aminoacyl-tRNA hydrolase [Rhodospirillaceae bacterium]